MNETLYTVREAEMLAAIGGHFGMLVRLLTDARLIDRSAYATALAAIAEQMPTTPNGIIARALADSLDGKPSRNFVVIQGGAEATRS